MMARGEKEKLVQTIVMYPCGCTVSRQTARDSGVTGVGVCRAHLKVYRESYESGLAALAGTIASIAIESGRPITLDTNKMKRTVEKALELEAAEGGPVDGSA
jgi:hypothetical protein